MSVNVNTVEGIAEDLIRETEMILAILAEIAEEEIRAFHRNTNAVYRNNAKSNPYREYFAKRVVCHSWRGNPIDGGFAIVTFAPGMRKRIVSISHLTIDG